MMEMAPEASIGRNFPPKSLAILRYEDFSAPAKSRMKIFPPSAAIRGYMACAMSMFIVTDLPDPDAPRTMLFQLFLVEPNGSKP